MIKTDALIIGAGPTGLFTAHQLKLIGLDCEIVDNLDKIGGQCIELYPDKPIYDIPAVPECTGEELTNNLINQLKPFDIKFHLSERVDEVKKEGDMWIVKTNKGTSFTTPNVIIAGGVGSFEPRKFSVEGHEKFENKSILYSIKDKNKTNHFKNFTVNRKIINLATKDAIFMHCLPAKRGKEVTSEVLDGKNSVILQQAKNRMYIQQAILLYVFKK